MPKSYLPEGEDQPLAGWILRGIRRLLNHMNRFEVFPEGVGRVCQPSVGESVSGEEVAEFVVETWLGNAREDRDESAGTESQESYEQDDSGRAPCGRPEPTREKTQTGFPGQSPKGESDQNQADESGEGFNENIYFHRSKMSKRVPKGIQTIPQFLSGIGLQAGNEVKPSFEYPLGGPGIESKRLLPGDPDLQGFEYLEPTLSTPVFITDWNPLTQVPGSIHETQRGPCEEPLQDVILDEDRVTADTKAFSKESEGVFDVVENVEEQNGVNAGVSVGKRTAVKELHGNPGFVPDPDVDSPNRKIRPKAHDPMGDESVTTADIQDASVSGDQVRHVETQHARSPVGNVMPMGKFSDSHFLPRPMMLTMKLEKTV